MAGLVLCCGPTDPCDGLTAGPIAIGQIADPCDNQQVDILFRTFAGPNGETGPYTPGDQVVFELICDPNLGGTLAWSAGPAGPFATVGSFQGQDLPVTITQNMCDSADANSQQIYWQYTCLNGGCPPATTVLPMTLDCCPPLIIPTFDPNIPADCLPLIQETVDTFNQLLSCTDGTCYAEQIDIQFDWGVSGSDTDGIGGFLAFAQPGGDLPNGFNGNDLPTDSRVVFDSADLTNACAAAPDFFRDVVTHEILHAIGFSSGVLFFAGLLDSPTDPKNYIGPCATQAYGDLLGTGIPTPLPMDGSHWDETLFDDEIMTPQLFGASDFSILTLCVLEDLGYCVNRSVVEEPYTLP